MTKIRTLALRRESVTDLSTDELRGVSGGVSTDLWTCWTGGSEPTVAISCVDCPSIPLTGCTILDTRTLLCPTDIC